MIKFYSYVIPTLDPTLSHVDVVVHLDIDVLVMQPFDTLLDGIVEGDASR